MRMAKKKNRSINEGLKTKTEGLLWVSTAAKFLHYFASFMLRLLPDTAVSHKTFAQREFVQLSLFFFLLCHAKGIRVAFQTPQDMNIAFSSTPKHWHYLWRQSSSAVKWALSACTKQLTSNSLLCVSNWSSLWVNTAGIQSTRVCIFTFATKCQFM